MLEPNKIVLSPTNNNIGLDSFLKVEACGVCTTDRKAFSGPPASMQLPRVLGHEISGTLLVDLGTLTKGTKVVLWPALICNSCEYCLSDRPHLCKEISLFGLHLDGGFRDTLSLTSPESLQKIVALPHPPSLSHQAAVFAEPLGCVLHGFSKTKEIPEKIMIYGAGLMGNLASQAASCLWPEVEIMLFESNPQRRTSPLMSQLMVSEPKPADLVFIACSSSEAVCSGLDLLKPGGTLVLFSGLSHDKNQIKIDHNQLHRKEQTLVGSYGCTPDDMKKALDLLASNRVVVKDLITQTLPLSQLPGELVRKTNHQDYKTIIIPEQ